MSFAHAAQAADVNERSPFEKAMRRSSLPLIFARKPEAIYVTASGGD
jgi:hypothetical protein